MIIYKQFTFDSAHFLPRVPEGHKCGNMHGHTYTLTVFYADLKKDIQPIIELIDHKILNNIADLNNPTSELLSIWLWNRIKPLIPRLKKIELKETPTSEVIYDGNQD